MRVALDISPLHSGHKYRGTGFYTLHLKEALEKYFSKKHQFFFFTESSKRPSNVDIIHYLYFDPFSASIPLFPQIPVVVTVLDLTPIVLHTLFPAGLKGNLIWQRQKFALKRISGVMTDSYSAKQDVEKIVGISSEKVGMAYLAAGESFCKLPQTSHRKKIIEKYALPEKFALYVGDVTRNKNLPLLVKAALSAQIPLVMAGKALALENFDTRNPWNKDLVEVQKLAKNQNSISILGFVPDEDLVALYNNATMFVMPSLYEGFGLPILEAMSCGCPVVTSREGSLKEVAGEAAFFIDPYDVHSISQGMKKVFTDVSLQKNLSAKGLFQARKFSWKKTAKETIIFYEKILNK